MIAKRDPLVDWTGQKHLPLESASRVVRVEPEASVLKRVLEALWTVGGVYAFRNTVGAVRSGGRWIKYGLGRGSSDIVAIVAPYGRMLCIEVKRPRDAETSAEQEAWLRRVRAYGAVAGIVRSPEEALALVEEARRPVVVDGGGGGV